MHFSDTVFLCTSIFNIYIVNIKGKMRPGLVCREWSGGMGSYMKYMRPNMQNDIDTAPVRLSHVVSDNVDEHLSHPGEVIWKLSRQAGLVQSG